MWRVHKPVIRQQYSVKQEPCDFLSWEVQYTYGEDLIQVNLLDQLNNLQPKYLFMVYGMNDVGNNISVQNFKKSYNEAIEKIQNVCPNTTLIISSISPIDSDYSSNKTINNFNTELESLCDSTLNVIFANTNELLVDSAGELEDNYDGGDGIHLSAAAYDELISRYFAK